MITVERFFYLKLKKMSHDHVWFSVNDDNYRMAIGDRLVLEHLDDNNNVIRQQTRWNIDAGSQNFKWFLDGNKGYLIETLMSHGLMKIS